MIDPALLDVVCPLCNAGPLEPCTANGRYMESTVHFPRRVRADVPLVTEPVRKNPELCMAEKHAWTAENIYTAKDGREFCRPCRDARQPSAIRPKRGRPLATHCGRGHKWTPENSYIPKSGGRYCIDCKQLTKKKKATT